MEACDGMVFYIQSFLIMVIYTYIVCSASHLNRFTSREMPSGTDWTGGLIGPRGSRDALEEKLSCPCTETNADPQWRHSVVSLRHQMIYFGSGEVTGNISENRPRTADKRWFSSLGVGRRYQFLAVQYVTKCWDGLRERSCENDTQQFPD